MEVKETLLEVPEVDIKELSVHEFDNEPLVELITHTEERKAIQLISRNKFKANVLSKLERVCKCALDDLSDNQKLEHFKCMHNDYKNCRKCGTLYNKLADEVHNCKIKKTTAKKIPRNINFCTVCGKKSHRANYHSTIPEKCENCEKSFKNNHFKEVHLYHCSRLEMPCLICGKLVKDMKRHILFSHTPDSERKLKCERCGKTVKQMKKHIKLCHIPDSEKKFVCEQCGKGFQDEKNMEIHTNIHFKLKPHFCTKGCDLGFADPANRRNHERRVHKEVSSNIMENTFNNYIL